VIIELKGEPIDGVISRSYGVSVIDYSNSCPAGFPIGKYKLMFDIVVPFVVVIEATTSVDDTDTVVYLIPST